MRKQEGAWQRREQWDAAEVGVGWQEDWLDRERKDQQQQLGEGVREHPDVLRVTMMVRMVRVGDCMGAISPYACHRPPASDILPGNTLSWQPCIYFRILSVTEICIAMCFYIRGLKTSQSAPTWPRKPS